MTHPGACFLVRGLGAVTVAGSGLYMDLGHWHPYPDGNQFPGKKIKDWARGAMSTDSDKYHDLEQARSLF